MNVLLLMVGKTEEVYLKEGILIFEKRLRHYVNYQTIFIPSLKNTKHFTPDEFKSKEGDEILKQTAKADYIVILDEKGKSFRSVEFAGFLQQQMNSGSKNLMFIVGGAYGFSDKVYAIADLKISFSEMTFSHQMIRLFFTEQLYRAFTILKNEAYHNE
ncbi:MAG: 23S rRNA (pseudouridine(1915)-N(3))-methyltransferase RlmH [Bacteroidales bacterium]